MGNSSKKYQDVIDIAAAKGISIPGFGPAGFANLLALSIGNDAMSALVAERFNWKWNRKTANPFYTNSYQQDYPQIGLTDIGWIEDGDRVDINNTSLPKPTDPIRCVKQLSRTSCATYPVNRYCWMYNRELSYGTWPGPNQVYSPLITQQVKQNPIMSMIDPNGNLLVVTGFGTTSATASQTASFAFAQRTALTFPTPAGIVTLSGPGVSIPAWLVGINIYVTIVCSDPRFNGTFLITSTGNTTIGGQPYWTIGFTMTGTGKTTAIAQEPVTGTIALYTGPVLPASSAEGATVVDGSVIWSVVSPDSQGFRVYPLPGASGPVYQITPYYQAALLQLTSMGQLLNPLPDDQVRVYQVGVEALLLQASKDPGDQKRGEKMYAEWLKGLLDLKKQGDREVNDYAMIPGASPVASVYEYPYGRRNPQDPSQPY